MARKETVVGLDLGRHTAKAVWLERDGAALRVARCEALALPSDVSAQRQALLPWVAKLGLARRPCALALPGQHVVFHPQSVAPGDPRDLGQIAAMQVLQITDISPEAMTYGYAPFTGQGGDRHVLIAMARSAMVDGVLDLAAEMNLLVVNLLPAPVAAFNALRTALAGTTELQLLADIGHSATSLVVGHAGGILFARTFALGGAAFTDALAKALRIPPAQAETLKLSGEALRKEGAPETAALRSAAALWITELQACLAVYKNLFPGPEWQPRRLWLSGGGAGLPGLAELAAARLGLPVAPVAPRIVTPNGERPERLVTAIGLGLAGLSDAGAGLSLLPARVRDELAFRRQKPMWIAAAAAAAAILAVSLIAGYRDIRRKEAQLDAQRVSLARRQELAAQIERTRARAAVVRDLAEVVARDLRAGLQIRDLIEALARCKEPRDVITVVADAESYFARRAAAEGATDPLPAAPPPAAEPAATNRPPAPFERVLVEGYTRRSAFTTVRDLIGRLKAEPFVVAADLLSDELAAESSAGAALRDGPGQRFVIEVKLAAP